VSALEDVISEWVKVTSTWTEGFVSWFKEWESKSLRLHAGINIQGVVGVMVGCGIRRRGGG
jgi:hypothetical protein